MKNISLPQLLDDGGYEFTFCDEPVASSHTSNKNKNSLIVASDSSENPQNLSLSHTLMPRRSRSSNLNNVVEEEKKPICFTDW
jgi:hypothetical protein